MGSNLNPPALLAVSVVLVCVVLAYWLGLRRHLPTKAALDAEAVVDERDEVWGAPEPRRAVKLPYVPPPAPPPPVSLAPRTEVEPKAPPIAAPAALPDSLRPEAPPLVHLSDAGEGAASPKPDAAVLPPDEPPPISPAVSEAKPSVGGETAPQEEEAPAEQSRPPRRSRRPRALP